MAVINTQQSGGRPADAVILPTDVYLMEIMDAVIEDDQFAEPRKDGSKQQRIVVTWEVYALTPEQQEVGEESEPFLNQRVWQRFAPYYGPVRDGGDSKFKAFIDMLREQGYLKEFDPMMFDTDALVGIKQRVSVENYKKTMGPNAGQPGNKVVSVLPIRRGKASAVKAAPKGTVEEEDLPF